MSIDYQPRNVRLTGLEPARREVLDPKSNASTNFATGANISTSNLSSYPTKARLPAISPQGFPNKKDSVQGGLSQLRCKDKEKKLIKVRNAQLFISNNTAGTFDDGIPAVYKCYLPAIIPRALSMTVISAWIKVRDAVYTCYLPAIMLRALSMTVSLLFLVSLPVIKTYSSGSMPNSV